MSAAGGADDNNVVNGGMCGEGVCSPDSDFPGNEDANPHEGSTGFQNSDEVLSEFLSNAAIRATTAVAITSAEKRFTACSLNPVSPPRERSDRWGEKRRSQGAFERAADLAVTKADRNFLALQIGELADN